jgi:hypothetical protein
VSQRRDGAGCESADAAKTRKNASASAAATLQRQVDARRRTRCRFLVHDAFACSFGQSLCGFDCTLLGELIIPARERGACFFYCRAYGLPDAAIALGAHDTLSISFFR